MVENGRDIFEEFYPSIKKANETWALKCPCCNKPLKCKNLQLNKVKVHCDNCGFTYVSKLLWYENSISLITDYLCSEHKVSFNDAYKWARAFKYTQPSYKVSKTPRTNAVIKECNILSPFLSMLHDESKILLTDGDLYVDACKIIKNFIKNYNFKKLYTISDLFTQNSLLSLDCKPKLLDGSLQDLFTNKKYLEHKNTFDFVLSICGINSKMHITESLLSIADALKPGGKALISIPKMTHLINPQEQTTIVSGVYKTNKKTKQHSLDVVWPESELNIILKTISTIPKLTNTIVVNGNDSSIDYYILVEKTN